MTDIDTEPNWSAAAPPEALAAVIAAAEHAAHNRADASSLEMAESSASPAWLRIAAVRSLAGLLAGPNAAAWFDKLRDDAHELAAQIGAPDEQVRLSLAAIALAQAYESGAIGRCVDLVNMSEFSDIDIAYAAAVHAGSVVAYVAGEQTAEVFARLRQRHGVQGGAA
jgi:hypothetical protein